MGHMYKWRCKRISNKHVITETTDELIDGRNASHITPTALDRWEGRLEDVFSGQPFDMLNAALSDTVSKIPADIQVLEPKSLSKLLEAIDPSQLPDCLGGSCTCSTEGLCLRSNKGPWSDPQIMKVRASNSTPYTLMSMSMYHCFAKSLQNIIR